MDFVTSIKTCLSKFITVQGRASRSEYWYFMLFTVLVNVVLSVVSGMLGELGLILYMLVLLALTVPGVTAAVRRLHDTDRSGWLYLVVLVPAVGAILVLIWLCKAGTPGANRFGEPVLPALDAPANSA